MVRVRILSFLAVAAPLLVLPRISPDEWMTSMSAAVVLMSASVVLALATRADMAARGAWTLIGIGMLLWGIGEVVWCWYELVPGVELPFPSYADVFYLGAVPFLATGLYRMGRHDGLFLYRLRALDLAVICIGAGAAIWTLSGSGHEAFAASGLERIILVAYPTADVVLVGMSSYALMSAARSPAVLCLTLGVVSLVIADVGFVHLVQIGEFSGDHPITLFWPLAFVLIGVGAIVSRDGAGRWTTPVDRRPLALRLLLLVSSLLIPATGAWAWSVGLDVHAPIQVAASSLMTMMVLVRLTSMSRELERANGEIRRARDRMFGSSEIRGLLLERSAQASEDGRRSVAADLHDGPIQSLAALQYCIEAAMLCPSPDAQDIGSRAVDGIGREIHNLRGIMSWLRPPSLDERGLEHALSDLGARLGAGTGAEVTVRCEMGTALAPELAATVYRLVEEGLRNVARHATATNVLVDIRSDQDAVSFVITDDGGGFDPSELAVAPHSGRFGLATMRERVELSGGSWELQVNPGVGVSIRARIPVANRHDVVVAPLE